MHHHETALIPAKYLFRAFPRCRGRSAPVRWPTRAFLGKAVSRSRVAASARWPLPAGALGGEAARKRAWE